MATRMLGFTATPKEMPEKRAATLRAQDHDEIYRDFARAKAAEQAARCSQCGVPFCQIHCPVANNIPDWLKLVAEGRLEEAYEVSQETNSFPEICGRICPQDRLCEGNCTIEQSAHGTVTIGAIERYITETAFANGWVKPRLPAMERGLSVGVIGAGPAGLACAEWLRAQGWRVHVYDRYDRVGGLMIYGIPGFKLEKHVVQRREAQLRAQGVVFHLNHEVGRDSSLDSLRVRHDALFLATGVYQARAIAAPGVGAAGIHPALAYLTASNRVTLGDSVPAYLDGSLNAAGKEVVVVGGGDTAMDCVRTAVRQGARSVTCLYRRDRANMPGSQREVAHAEEEGVRFLWLCAPEAFLTDGEGRVSGVRAHRMHLGEADATGRAAPRVLEGSSFTLPAGLVIQALGFDPEDLPSRFGSRDLRVSRWGTVVIDARTRQTSLEGVFAGGDIVRGASLVVWAIRDGRDAAARIHRRLLAREARQARAAA